MLLSDLFVFEMGISPFLAHLSCYTEFIGGFLLIVGLLARPAAFAIMINVLVAVLVHFRTASLWELHPVA